MAKCVYCNEVVPKGRAMEICDRCGVGIWGQKMFLEIVSKTNEEMGKGNLDLGSVGG